MSGSMSGVWKRSNGGEPVRHRQTKGAATDMFDLQPPRHTPTLPIPAVQPRINELLLPLAYSLVSIWRAAASSAPSPRGGILRGKLSFAGAGLGVPVFEWVWNMLFPPWGTNTTYLSCKLRSELARQY